MTTIAQLGRQPSYSPVATNDPRLNYASELELVTGGIREPLVRVESLLQSQLSSQYQAVHHLLRYVSELGGKRLRPALVLLSAMTRGEISEETIRIAAAVELVHTATLVHDDILDDATTRRHRPSLHCQSNVHDGILTGDWLFTQAYALVNEGESTFPGRKIAQAAKEVCEGEIRQNLMAGQNSMAIDDYLSLLGQKTGSLCAVSCSLGAWSAGASDTECRSYHDFGWKLGTAFQVHDDCLDYWGDGSRLGKKIGGDFAAGKWTLPILRLLECVDDGERNPLIDSLRARNAEAFSRVSLLMEQYRVAEYCREVARNLSRDAVACLQEVSPSLHRQQLERLAILAVDRGA